MAKITLIEQLNQLICLEESIKHSHQEDFFKEMEKDVVEKLGELQHYAENQE